MEPVATVVWVIIGIAVVLIIAIVILIIAAALSSRPRVIENAVDEQGNLCCPRCKSTKISTGARGMSGGLLNAHETVNRCGNCGFVWYPKGWN